MKLHFFLLKRLLINKDGIALNEQGIVGLVNLPLHTILRQINVTLQQTPLSHSGNNYPYKAYIDTIFKTNEIDQNGVLTSQLFYKDTRLQNWTKQWLVCQIYVYKK